MYAVVETGGKQYKVEPGQIFRVSKLEGDKGSSVTLDKVLLVAKAPGDVKIGAPYVSAATVTAKVVEQHRTRKIIVFHYKQKKDIRTKKGHRQHYTSLQVESIQG